MSVPKSNRSCFLFDSGGNQLPHISPLSFVVSSREAAHAERLTPIAQPLDNLLMTKLFSLNKIATQ